MDCSPFFISISFCGHLELSSTYSGPMLPSEHVRGAGRGHHEVRHEPFVRYHESATANASSYAGTNQPPMDQLSSVLMKCYNCYYCVLHVDSFVDQALIVHCLMMMMILVNSRFPVRRH